MRELLALTGRHLRTTLRSRAARVAFAGFVLGLLAAAWGAGHAAGFLLLATLLVVVLLVSGFAVGAGSVLPEDRVAGREEWLATLAPAGWQRRLSVVLAGWLLAAGLGVAGGALVGLVAGGVRPELALRAWQPVALQGSPLLGGGGAAVTLTLPPEDGGMDEIEVDVRPLYPHFSVAPIDRVDVLWVAGTTTGTVRASARGPLRLTPPAGTRSVQLACLTPGVRLRMLAARRLGPARPTVPTLAWTGFLLGLCAGAVVPVAVLVSRATSAQTAAVAATSLLLLGSVKGGLLALAARLEPSGLEALVPPLLHAFARLAPDTPVLDVLAEATAQRAPALGALGTALPALLYTVVVALLVCLPAPSRLGRRGAA